MLAKMILGKEAEMHESLASKPGLEHRLIS